jgi:hypothetical protein
MVTEKRWAATSEGCLETWQDYLRCQNQPNILEIKHETVRWPMNAQTTYGGNANEDDGSYREACNSPFKVADSEESSRLDCIPSTKT